MILVIFTHQKHFLLIPYSFEICCESLKDSLHSSSAFCCSAVAAYVVVFSTIIKRLIIAFGLYTFGVLGCWQPLFGFVIEDCHLIRAIRLCYEYCLRHVSVGRQTSLFGMSIACSSTLFLQNVHV